MNKMCLNKRIASNADNAEEKNATLVWFNQLLLRKQEKTNNKIKQQKQQTLITSKTLSRTKNQNLLARSK